MKTVICYDKDKNEYEVPVEKLVFRPSVYGIIIQGKNILITHVMDGFDFPGGGINVGEDTSEALVREIHEETGLEVKVGRLVTCENAFYKRSETELWHSILVYYVCEVIGGKLTLDGLDAFEKEHTHDLPEWVPLADIEKIKFYNSVDSLKIIKAALKK